MLKIMLAIFIGGGTGSLLRFAVQYALHRQMATVIFPWATLTINIVGSFFIGLFYAWAVRFHFSETTRLFLTTGLCGGFTTFSTFSHEGLVLFRDGHYAEFAGYIVLSVVVGVAFAFFGGWCGVSFFGKS